MPLWNIPYTFSNGSTADANQVDQNFTSLQNLLNGGQDDANMKTGGLSKAIATEGVAPSQSIGLPYGIDVFGSTGFVLSGLTVTKDGTNLNQVNVAAGVAYVLQSSGSANGQLRRLTPAATNYRTSAANSTYYLDLNPDGSYTWGGHSTQANYITIATITSDASSNVNVITNTSTISPPFDTWHNFTLTNGVTNYGTGYANASYRKDANGWVHVRGLVNLPTTTPGYTFATFPAGYRPSSREPFTVFNSNSTDTSTSRGTTARVDVDTSGNLIFNSGTNATGALLGLSGISFLAEQ